MVAEETQTPETPQELASTSESSWWIMGLVLGVAALLIAGIVYIRRRRRVRY